jgi:hypothetical protein
MRTDTCNVLCTHSCRPLSSLTFGRPGFADEPSGSPPPPPSHGSPLRTPAHTSEQRGPAPLSIV